MINLTYRQINLLAEVFTNEIITLEQLCDTLNVSPRTVYKEIRIINDLMQGNGINIKIINKSKRGYSYTKEKLSGKEKIFKKQIIMFTDNKMVLEPDNKRIIKILFILLMGDGFIKSIDIAESLYISDTTLTKDLKIVRKILSYYELKINSIPYKGMTVKGKKNAKISCLIDYSNFYNFKERPDFLKNTYYTMLNTTKEKMLNNKNQLNYILKQENYRVPDEGFKRILVYLQLNEKIKKKSFSSEIKYLLDQSQKELIIAKKLLITTNINEQYNLAAFIFINADSNYNNLQDFLIASPLQSKYKEVNDFISTYIGLDLKQSPEFNQVVLKKILNEYIKRKTNFSQLTYSKEKLRLASHLNITNALSFIIFGEINKKFTNKVNVNDLLNLSLSLYNICSSIPNPHEKIDVLMINNFGLAMNDSFIYRVDLDTKYVNLHHYYEHELTEINLEDFHAIISTTNDLIIPEDITTPYFNFDYYSDKKEGKKIWDKIIVRNKRKTLLGKNLTNITTTNLGDKEDLFNYLANKIFINKISENHQLQMLKKWWELSLLLGSKEYINIYSFNHNGESTVEKIILDQNNTDEIKIIYHFDLNLNNKYLTIKQADSVIRGFI